MKQLYPTIKQANFTFLMVSIVLLAGSSILLPKLGIGTNLWINELLWILTPVLILSKVNKWPGSDVFKFQSTLKRNKLISILSAVCLWFFSFYLSKSAAILLNSKVGLLNTGEFNNFNLPQGILVLIGMILLAPICEEIFFRGFVQSAYEQYNKKYGFVYAAVFFGMFHVLNGITEIVPTFLIGLVLGYLVYRTGSITTSIMAHMAFNMSAVLFDGAFGLSFLTEIPTWLHFVSIGGLILTILLLHELKPERKDDSKTVSEEEVNTMKPGIAKFTIASLVLFVLSGLFVIVISAVEIYVRLNT